MYIDVSNIFFLNGVDMFHENIWSKSGRIKFVTALYFICHKRECNNKLAIDVILIALERQTVSPIINCKIVNHMVRPLWDDIREEVFSTINDILLMNHSTILML